MNRILRIIIGLCLCFSFSVTNVSASTNTYTRSVDNYLVPNDITVTDSNKDAVLSTPAVDATEKVYDFADLFTTTQEDLLYDQVIEYINSFDMDLIIVTINENNKSNSANYADDFYDYNNFGINSSRDGILFLIDMQNRMIYMSTSGGAINMYNDYRIEEALDAVYAYMSDENYYQGVTDYIEIISSYAEEGIPSGSNSDEFGIIEELLFSFVISVVITLLVMFILVSKNKLVRKATTAREYLKKDSISIQKEDRFIGTNTVKHKIETSSSSGGSSTHSGSSGRSHGGGGHRF